MAETFLNKIKKALQTIDKGLDKKIIEKKEKKFSPTSFMESLIDFSIKNPKKTIIIFTVVSLLIATPALTLPDRIQGDMEVYLPTDDPRVETLKEIREDWSTDIIILYVDANPGFKGGVTNVSVLNDMSNIEVALDPYGQGIDSDGELLEDDRGKRDGILFCLSLSVIIKQLNATPEMLSEAMQRRAGQNPPQEIIDYNYSIPNQERVDNFMRELYDPERPEAKEILKMLILGDSFEDEHKSAVILFGMAREYENGEKIDQRAFMKKVNEIIKIYAKNSTITITGVVPLIHAIEDRTFSEMAKVIPAAIIFGALALFAFHRTLKVVFIILGPIGLAIAPTFGILGSGIVETLGMVLAPQFVVVAPVMVGLGMFWSLYLVNRYTEGTETDRIERMRNTIKAMSQAIFLSFVAALIAVSAMFITGMPPITITGFSFVVGLIFLYFYIMILVPAMIMLLQYRKKVKAHTWDRLGEFVYKHWKKSLIIALIITLISASMISFLTTNVDYSTMAPSDEPTLNGILKYSKEFGGGGIGMILIRGKFDNKTEESLTNLQAIDTLQYEIRNVKEEMNKKYNNNEKYITAISVVDVMKIVKTTEEMNVYFTAKFEQFGIKKGFNIDIPTPVFVSFWDIINGTQGFELRISSPLKKEIDKLAKEFWASSQGKEIRLEALGLFYETLNPEIKRLVLTEDYRKTLIYINQPIALSINEIRDSVDGIDSAIHNLKKERMEIDDLTGVVALAISLNDKLLRDTVITNILSVIMVLIAQAFMYRSIRVAIFSTIPVSMVLSWQPLVLVATNIPLTLITVAIGAIAIAAGIDYALQMTVRIRVLGGATVPNIKKSASGMGVSFIESTITMIAALSAIFLIPIPSIYQFVVISIILLIMNALVAMFVLPAIYILYLEWSEKRWKILK